MKAYKAFGPNPRVGLEHVISALLKLPDILTQYPVIIVGLNSARTVMPNEAPVRLRSYFLTVMATTATSDDKQVLSSVFSCLC